MRRLLGFATTLIILSSCGSTTLPAARPMPPLTGDPRLLFTIGGGNGVPQLVLWDVRHGAQLQTLPMGAISPDHRFVYVVDTRSPAQLRAIDIASGRTVATLAIPDGYGLVPDFGGSQPIGLSPNGAWLTLQAFDRPSQYETRSSRYLVIDTSFRTRPREIGFDGQWDFDAISNDGQRLYLLQYVNQPSAPSAYHVRLYDFAAHALWPQVIVDKRLWGDAMSGTRLTAVPSLDQSWLFSLYAFGPNGSFIHALSLDPSTQLAWCVDLPSNTAGNDEQEMLWTLLRGADGQRLYAVNASEGVAAEISFSGDSPPPAVTRTARFAVQQSSPTSFLGLVVNAEAKRFLTGGAVLSTDWRTIYALGDKGIYAIDTGTLKVRQQYLPEVPLDSIEQTSDGKTLFTSSMQQNKIFRVDLGAGQSQALTNIVEVNSLVGIEAP